MPKVFKVCYHCKKGFYTWQPTRVYCSRKCYADERWRTEKPDNPKQEQQTQTNEISTMPKETLPEEKVIEQEQEIKEPTVKEQPKQIKTPELPVIKLARLTWIRNQCTNADKIIDIGGNRGHTFSDFPKENVVVVDIDDYDIKHLKFVRADAHNLPFPDKSFDVAVLGEILEHVEDPVQVLKEAKRVARKKIVITTPNEYEWSPELMPFESPEEAARKQGLTLEEMVKRDNPAKELYSADGYKHLFHNRYYTYETLVKDLKSAGIENYEIAKLIEDKFVIFVVVCHLD